MSQFLIGRWVRRLFTRRTPPPPARPSFRPTLERLEDRLTPSVAFAPQQTFDTNRFAYRILTADFNGDGRPDLAVYDDQGDVEILLNTTVPGAKAPSFAAPQTFAAVGGGTGSMAVGDFNGDGRPDLAVVSSSGGPVAVLLNTTTTGASVLSFAAPVNLGVGNNVTSLAVGDFNGDGRPDLVTVDDGDATVSVLLNTTAAGATVPSFAPRTTFAAGRGPVFVAVGDFNGDGRPDLAVTVSGGVLVLLDTTAAGAAIPQFAAQTTLAIGDSPELVAVGDFNGDGKPDLVTSNDDGTVSVLLNTTAAGDGTSSFGAQQTFNAGGLGFVAVADLNDDGRPDIVVANLNDGGTGSVSVLLNTTTAGASAPQFAPQQTFSADAGFVAVGDFNGDGQVDLDVSNEPVFGQASYTLSVLTNITAPTPLVVADFRGKGVYEYDPLTSAWTALNPGGPDSTLLAADPAGDVSAISVRASSSTRRAPAPVFGTVSTPAALTPRCSAWAPTAISSPTSPATASTNT